MKKILFLFTTLFLRCVFAHAQSTLNSSGNTLKDNTVNYAYSIGEVSGFSVKPYCSYTQGVIQPARFMCVPVKYEYNELYEISFYPNPTRNVVIIETDYPDFKTYKIMAADGRLVQSGKFTYSPISLQTLSTGTYLIQLFSSDSKIKKSFKIIKTN